MNTKETELNRLRRELKHAGDMMKSVAEARCHYGATGFPIGLYPDPMGWAEERLSKAADRAILASMGEGQ